ncbi:FAD:protein FMN transferase [Oleiphilus sp. HI0080]|nr:FAD:protein FMN transferase [Oleiphilus sp. HI0080]
MGFISWKSAYPRLFNATTFNINDASTKALMHTALTYRLSLSSKIMFLQIKFSAYLIAFFVLTSSTLSQASEDAGWSEFSHTAMTTRIELVFWFEDPSKAKPIADRVFASFDEIDRTMNRYNEDSELSFVNTNAAIAPVRVSDGLFAVLFEAQKVSQLTDGAFDISFASVGYLYDFRRNVQPTEAMLSASIDSVDYRKITLDELSKTVSLQSKTMRLDLGGIAKGYSVDRAVEILKQAGVKNARVSAGGDMRLLGDKRGKPWVVGIRDPRVKSDNAVVLPLENVAISTSGDYERFFVNEEGTRVHHILSPKTGKPAKGIQSVTILGEHATQTDALSTAVFILGLDKGLALINSMPGIDVIILDEHRRMHYSSDLTSPSK